MKKFEFLEHTADVKFRSYGKSLEKAFENASLALKKTITRGEKIEKKQEKNFIIEEGDLKSKLQSFLEEFLYLLDAEDFIFSKVEVKEKQGRFEVTVLGDKASKYNLTSDVKAITYNEMFVKREGEGWVCQVVLDV